MLADTDLFVLLQATGLFLQTFHHFFKFFFFFRLLSFQVFLANCCLRDGLFTAGWYTAHFLQLKIKADE